MLIAECFKLRLLSATVVHECITRLLKFTSDNDSLEYAAVLLTAVGQRLDTPEAKVRSHFSKARHVLGWFKPPAQWIQEELTAWPLQ